MHIIPFEYSPSQKPTWIGLNRTLTKFFIVSLHQEHQLLEPPLSAIVSLMALQLNSPKVKYFVYSFWQKNPIYLSKWRNVEVLLEMENTTSFWQNYTIKWGRKITTTMYERARVHHSKAVMLFDESETQMKCKSRKSFTTNQICCCRWYTEILNAERQFAALFGEATSMIITVSDRE